MKHRQPIGEKIHWIGVNDRETTRFENFWPLERGVSYNSYLIDDEKVAVIDTVKFNKTDLFLLQIKQIIGDKKVDYLIVNHMEPDHSSAMQALLNEYPDMQIVGNKKTFPMIEGFYDITQNFYEVKEGDELDLGHHKLKFFMTPMVHWPETMMTYDMKEQVLFSMDAFGGFGALDGNIFDDDVKIESFEDEIRRYYSNIVGKYSPQVQKALKKLADVPVKMICPTHGIVWHNTPETIINFYDKWSRYEAEAGVVIVYGSMYGNTARMAEFLARILYENGIEHVKIYDSSKTHASYILSDIWQYKGLIIGSCAYNTEMFPAIKSLTDKISHSGIKNRYISIFGNKGWSGGGVKNLIPWAESTKCELIGESVEATYSPKVEDFKQLEVLAKNMAEKVLANPN